MFLLVIAALVIRTVRHTSNSLSRLAGETDNGPEVELDGEPL